MARRTTCPSCEFENRPIAAFCAFCGDRLAPMLKVAMLRTEAHSKVVKSIWLMNCTSRTLELMRLSIGGDFEAAESAYDWQWGAHSLLLLARGERRVLMGSQFIRKGNWGSTSLNECKFVTPPSFGVTINGRESVCAIEFVD